MKAEKLEMEQLEQVSGGCSEENSNGFRKTCPLCVDDAVIHDDSQPDMEEHRQQPFNDVHGHHCVIERSSRLYGRKRSGSGFLRDLQGTECVFHVSLRKQHRNYKIGDHGRQKDSQNLDATVTDAVQDRIFTGTVLFHDVFQNDMPSALFENACHDGSVKHIGRRASFHEPGDRIIRKDAEIMHAKLQHPGRDDKSEDTRNQIADVCLFFLLPAPV